MDMVCCRGDEAQASARNANMDEEFWAANTWQVQQLPPFLVGKWAIPTTMTYKPHSCSVPTSRFHPTCHFNSSRCSVWAGGLEYKKRPCVWNHHKLAHSFDGIKLMSCTPQSMCGDFIPVSSESWDPTSWGKTIW